MQVHLAQPGRKTPQPAHDQAGLANPVPQWPDAGATGASEFRIHAGIRLGRYLREWRLCEAALLLSSENLSVKETAERLGFRDIYAFSRAFNRALGGPPSSLRTG